MVVVGGGVAAMVAVGGIRVLNNTCIHIQINLFGQNLVHHRPRDLMNVFVESGRPGKNQVAFENPDDMESFQKALDARGCLVEQG